MADYITEEEQAERLKKWIRDYGLTIGISIVLGICSLAGWRYFQEYQSADLQAAADLYYDYVEARALEEPLDDIVSSIREEHGGSSYFVFTLLFEAKDAVEAESYTDAIDILTEALEIVSDDSLRDLIITRKARVESQLEQFDAALATLSSIKTEGFRSIALEIQGDILLQQGNSQEARLAYQASKDALNDRQSDQVIVLKIAAIPEGE